MNINITIPVFNEEVQLAESVSRLAAFCAEALDWPFEIVIADNGSTDATSSIARELMQEDTRIRLVRLELPGRGRALKQVWMHSDADVLAYMDVDLSTELAALPELIASLTGGDYDVAVGSRLLPSSRTKRCLRRELISRAYNVLVRRLLGVGFSDAQCGFKAITRPAAVALLPLVEHPGWFMDTELLVLAERLGYRILDYPVAWVEDPGSKVKLLSTAFDDLLGLLRLRRRLSDSSLNRVSRP